MTRNYLCLNGSTKPKSNIFLSFFEKKERKIIKYSEEISYWDVTDIKLNIFNENNGKSKNFVTMPEDDKAMTAIKCLHGREVDGSKIKVKSATTSDS